MKASASLSNLPREVKGESVLVGRCLYSDAGVSGGVTVISRIKVVHPLTQASKSVLGTAAKISGYNLFTRLNYWVVYYGGDIIQNPPPLHGVETLTEAVVTLTPTKFTFELEGEPDNAADLKLIIMASAPQSNGVTRAYGKAVQIAQPL